MNRRNNGSTINGFTVNTSCGTSIVLLGKAHTVINNMLIGRSNSISTGAAFSTGAGPPAVDMGNYTVADNRIIGGHSRERQFTQTR